MYNPYEISTTIKSVAKQQNLTVKKILEDCQINKGFIYDLEHKSAYPSCDKISRIADYLDCSIDYLLGRTDSPDIIRPASTSNEKIYLYKNPAVANNTIMEDFATYETSKGVAILGKVAAGTPILSYEVDYGNIIPENSSASYALIAQGDSMYPVIRDKETIEVVSQKNLENGEIGIISVDGNMTCKKFYDFEDHYELRSINSDYPTMHIKKEPSTNLQIRGKVSLTRAQNSRL